MTALEYSTRQPRLASDVKTLTAGFDTVMFCLSKGLCAPVGSLARRLRGTDGPGAASIARLWEAACARPVCWLPRDSSRSRTCPARLHEDRLPNARLLAEALANVDGVEIDPETVETNIVIFRLARIAEARRPGRPHEGAWCLLISAVGPQAVRLVTHNDVTRGDCVVASQALTEEIEAATTANV